MFGRFSATGRCNKNAPYFVGMVFGGLLPYVTFLFSWDYAIIIADKSCLLPWQRNDAWSTFGNRYSVYKKVHLAPDARILGLCCRFPLLDPCIVYFFFPPFIIECCLLLLPVLIQAVNVGGYLNYYILHVNYQY